MTIEREDPGVAFAVCDGCGERVMLELAEEADEVAEAEALKALGWRRCKPDRERFGLGVRYTIVYARDLCGDCQAGESSPQPRFSSAPVYHRTVVDPFINDPCDEWPRDRVFAAVGLRPDCGHPPGPSRCPYCEAGIPIGRSRASI